MKKRLLSALLALALVFVLLPTTALAEMVSDYFDCDISILGNYWKFEKDSNNEYLPVYYKSEASSFEDSTVAPENNYLEIRKTGEKEITITVHGDVNITATGISIDTIAANKSVIINGDGHLTVKYTWTISGQNYSAIAVSTLTVEGVALSAEASMGPALSATYGIHIKDGAMVEAKAGYFEAVCEGTTNEPGGITVDNATLVATATGGGNRSAIKTYGNIAFTNAKVTATNESSENAAIQAKTYKGTLNYLYVSGTSTITATNQSTSTDTMARAIGATIKNNNTSEKIEVGSSKVDAGKTWHTNAKQVTITSPALERDSYVYIADGPAVVGVETSIPSANGSGTYYYDQASKTLTLNNVTITSGTNAIQFAAAGTYTVKLEGTNKISNVSNGISVTDDKYITSLNVTITGTGSLDISAKGLAINMKKGDLKFENTGEIKLTTSNISPTHNVLSVSGNITIADMDKYSVTGITQTGSPNVTGDTVTLGEASHLKGYQNDNTWTYLKTITIASKPSEAYYNNTAMKYGETRDAGNGTISCDENGVITLNGVTEGTLEFRSSSDSTLVLEGTNTLFSIVTTQKGLTISGSGSLTVGSIKVHNQKASSDDKPNLTINGGAHVTVNRPSSEDKPAVEVSGNLTVTGDGTQLSAECTAATNPAIEVGGNVTISGNPGTNAYTVKAHNKYDTPRGRDDNLRPSQMPSAIEISGDSLSISNSARVMAKTDSDGAAVWMPAQKVISVVDASLIAQNSSHNFSTISFGDGSDMGNIYAKGQVNIVAENMLHSSSSLAHRAIKAHIYNHYSTGDSNPYYIKVVSEGVQSGGNVNVIPGHCTSTGGYKVTITRGDEVVRTQSPVVIAGTTLRNDTYYTITDGSTVVANGSESNYNAFYNSTTKTLKLNNAQISHSFAHEYGDGTDGAIIFKEYKNYCIELSGTNTISSMNTYAINGDTNSLTIKNAAGTENAKLTLAGNWTAICSTEGLNIQSDVTMVNTKRADHLMYVNGTFSFDGYNAYASVNASGSPLVEYTVPTSGDKDAGYQYLRITKETLETGGGSTHQHTYDQSAWKSDATHHWQECTDPNCPDPTKGITNKASHSFSNGACTVCGYRGQTEEHHFGTEWIFDAEYHWHKCTDEGCDAISGKAPHEWTGWRIDEPSPGMHNRFCNCGYNDYSHHYNLVYAAAGEAGHYQYCTLGNCTFKTSTVPHNYDGDTCTICNYTKSGEIVPPTPDNPGTIVIIRPAEEEKPAQQPNPSTGANDLVGLAVAAAVAAALGSAALLRKHD